MKSRATTSPRNHRTSYTNPLNATLTACALVIALAMVAPKPTFAQTFSVIYEFAGGPQGANPFAASKKSESYLNWLQQQAELSLWNGDLSDLGISVSGGVQNLKLSQGGGDFGGLLILSPDNWNGGAGNWSNAADWSAGEPGASSDVTIYSGGNDTVTLDVSTTISSLTLGGASNGTTSELTDGGVAQTLNITNALNVGATGLLDLTGGSTVTAGAASSNVGSIELLNMSSLSITAGGFTNSGILDVENGSTLSITGDVANSGSILTNFHNFGGGNTITISGMLTNSGTFTLNGPGDTGSIGNGLNNSGTVDVFNGSTLTITAGGVSNPAMGTIDVEQGSTLKITGDVTNSGTLATDLNSMGGNNTLTIVGNVTNSGAFGLLGAGDMGTVTGNLTNNSGGLVDVDGGSTLNIAGNVTNNAIGGLTGFLTGLSGAGGNTVNVGGTFTNNGLFVMLGAGDTATLGSLINNSGAAVDVEYGGTLNITGDVTNSSAGMDLGIYTDLMGNGGGNTINIGGMLTNNGTFMLNGPGDTGNIGNGLNNSGTVDVENGSTLNITGDVTNSGSMGTDLIGAGGGNTLTITGNLTNVVNFSLNGAGDTGTITGNVSNTGGNFIVANGASGMIGGNLLNNGGRGTVDLENGGMLTVAGDVTNSFGLLSTDFFKQGGGNILTINGTLTNGMNFELLGHGDVATVGNLINNPGAFVDVEGGSTLNITGNVTNSSGGLGEHGIFIRDNPGANTINIGGSLTNTGTFEVLGPGDTATIGMGVTNNVGARLDVEDGSALMITGDVNNAGILQTNFNGFGGESTITISGMLTNAATGTVNLNGPGDILQALAGLSNSGTINVFNGSSILPPFFNNLGTLNIDGTSRFVVGTPNPKGGQGYLQLANGTLGEMIASLNSFGVINVTGSALLDGTLAILLQGGYNPAVGSTFKFLNFTAGGLSGTFANIENDVFNGGTEKWMVDYDNADGFVELVAEPNQVPEPATLLVLIPGLLGLGYGLRRELHL